MSSDLRPFSTNASSAPAATSTQMSSASPWTNEVPLPVKMKTTTPHDFTLPIITLSNKGSDPRSTAAVCGYRMDDPASEGPRCLSLPLSRVHDQIAQQRPKQPPLNDPLPPPYTNCSSSLDNLSLCAPSDAALGGVCSSGGMHSRLSKASSDNPIYGSSASPPVPPRDYIPRAVSRPTVFDQRQHARPEIHPIVQDGQKRSNTHYWLLPDKQKTSASLDDVDKMTSDDAQHYVNIAGNGMWARKFGISKASSFGHQKSGSAVRKEDARRNHHSSEGAADTGGPRSVFYSDVVPLLSDVSSLDSMSVDIPVDEEIRDSAGSCCPSGEEGRTTSMGEVKAMIDVVQSKINGVTVDESFTALVTHQWNVQAAVEYLKVENLFRLGVASRERCRRRLEINNWNLESAASDLLDLIGIDLCK